MTNWLLNQAMAGWFSPQVEGSVTGAVDVARHHYRSMRRTLQAMKPIRITSARSTITVKATRVCAKQIHLFFIWRTQTAGHALTLHG